ncbi:MAG: SDR family oxidoreductase [Pseudomonadales bacterium]|nr:SDR family oxidoreductase [Pseudomonadales bacterium]
MDLNIKGKKAVVAAATKGLGFATAESLLAEGAEVAICGRDAGRVAEAVKKLGGGVVGITADVSTAEGATGFITEAIAALGQIDILVTNAGGPPPGMPSETSIEGFQFAIDLNLMSTVAMCSAALPGMTERKWGRIVAITSHAVREPSSFIAASSTARAGASAYLKVLSSEVAAAGITVNTVQPGAHKTDRLTDLGVDVEKVAKSIPVKFLGDATSFGQITAFLCSDIASFITGTSILVDGGAYGGM